MAKKNKQAKSTTTNIPSSKGLINSSAELKPNWYEAKKFQWDFKNAELCKDAKFSFAQLDISFFITKLLPKLQELQNSTWGEMKKVGSHHLAKSALSKIARDLVSKKNIDPELIYSLRMGSKFRIIGYREKAILRIIWWDSKHEFCPSNKK